MQPGLVSQQITIIKQVRKSMASSSMATLACLVVLEAMIGGAYVGILSSMLRRVASILH
jgi:hypothetical protein